MTHWWNKHQHNSETSDNTTPEINLGAAETDPSRLSETSLAKLLFKEGKASEVQLRDALSKQKASGAFLGEILINDGILDEQSLLNFLAKNCKIPHLSLLDYLIEPTFVSLVSEELCIKYRLLPIDRLGRNLTVAMVNPLDREALKAVQSACPDLRIKPILCAYRHFEMVAEKIFSSDQSKAPASLSMHDLGFSTSYRESAIPQAELDVSLETSDSATLRTQSSKIQEEKAGTTPATSKQSLASSDPQEAERESLLDTVFGNRLLDAEHSQEIPDQIYHDDDTQEETLESVMEATASAMVDSMRETYEMLTRRMQLFRGLRAEDVARIFSKGMTHEVEEGEVIFNKGDEADGLFIILDGEVTIFDGSHILAELGRGDTIGEMAMMIRGPRAAGARARIRTSLLKLTLQTIIDELPSEVSNRLLLNLVVTLSERLRLANARLLILLRNLSGNRY